MRRSAIRRRALSRVVTRRVYRKLKARGDLKRRIVALRPRLAAAAQRVYDDAWRHREHLGGFGICDEIADAMSYVLSGLDADIDTGGQEGSDHASVLVYNDDEAYDVDIPAHVYESGGGYRWELHEGVRFRASDVQVYEVDRRYI